MEAVSATTTHYDNIVTTHYQRLIVFAREDADNVNDCYLKVRNRLESKPFTAHTETELVQKLITYTKSTIFNQFKTNYTAKKNYIEVGHDAETQLQQEELEEQLELQELNQMRFEVQKLFEYLKKNYSEADNYVFRVYYLHNEQGKKITYKELSVITGYSISKCCGIIQKVKKDLRLNLIQYINGIN